MHKRTALLLVLLATMAASLACNLTIGQDNTPAATLQPVAQRPTVQIVEPVEGARFTKGQTVSVRATASSTSGITLVELLANGVRVASQTPPEGTNPTEIEVVLDYQAEQTGTVIVAVQAYSNNIVGPRDQRTITVLEELDPGDNAAPANSQTLVPPSATPYNPLCRARVNVSSLRFREGPSIDYDIIGNFTVGQEPQITGYLVQPDGRWWQVIWNSRTGWTAAQYTTQLGNCGNIPLAQSPSTPTPVPTDIPPPTEPGTTATPTLPDLRLSLLEGPTDIVLGPNGQFQTTYVIEVENTGGQPAPTFNLSVLRPDGTVENFDVYGLIPGQRSLVPASGLPITFDGPGVLRLLVTVDNTNIVAESNEANNQAYLDIRVEYGQATYTPVPDPADNEEPPDNGDLPDDGSFNNSNNNGDSTTGTVNVVPFSPISPENAVAVSEVDSMAGHGGTVTGLAFSPNSAQIASASRDGTVRLWNVANGTETITLAGHTDRVVDVAFSPDGARVASASWDGTARVWDAGTGAELASFTHGAESNQVAFSPTGARLASGGRNPDAQGGLHGLVRVWEIGSSQEIFSVEVVGPVTGVGFISDSLLAVATAGQDCNFGGGGLEVFDIAANSNRVIEGHGEWLTALALQPNAGLLASSGQLALCSGNSIAWVWDVGGAQRAALDHGSDTVINGLAFNPTGSVLATSSADGTLRLWNTTSGERIAALPAAQSSLESVAFSPDGVYVASGGDDSLVRLWGVQ